MDIHKYIIIHTLLFIQILMSAVMVQMMVQIVPKHVQILLEPILVDVILDIHWRLMGLHAVVCPHVQKSIHACNYK